MDVMMYNCIENDLTYDNFRSQICHMLKNYGDKKFLEEVLKYDLVGTLWKKNEHFKALYTLAMFDVVTKEFGVNPFSDYDIYRQYTMEYPVYPSGILMLDMLNKGYKEKCYKECSEDPIGREFLKYNIVEKDIRDVA